MTNNYTTTPCACGKNLCTVSTEGCIETSADLNFNSVRRFHKAFGHAAPAFPNPIDKETALKRMSWTAEELVEFLHATVGGQPEDFLDLVTKFKGEIEKAVVKQLAEGEYEDKSDFEIAVRQYDALVDQLVFVEGSFVVAGMDPSPGFNIVMDANMAKLGTDGKPIIRESDGKIMKPEGWVAPEPKLREVMKGFIQTGEGVIEK